MVAETPIVMALFANKLAALMAKFFAATAAGTTLAGALADGVNFVWERLATLER